MSNRMWPGIILIGAGLVFLSDSLDLMSFGHILRTYWPLLLILLGISLLVRGRVQPIGRDTSSIFRDDQINMDENSPSQKIESSKVFGDVNAIVRSQSFQGGSISTVLGDTNVNMRKADIEQGEQVLRLNGVVGDVAIELPENIEYSVSANTLLGDVRVNDQTSEGFGAQVSYQSPAYQGASKKLRIHATQVIGDIRVRRLVETR